MQIWVDADACPAVIKDILFRAADRVKIATILVANQGLTVPRSPNIRTIRVQSGFDEADKYIAEHVGAGDLVITADIPLAALVVEQGALAINPRGDLYTENNIRQRLSMRDFMEELRGTGVQTGGPAPINQTDRKRFANELDRILTRCLGK